MRLIDADALLDAMEEEIHFTAINASEQARVNNLFCDITDVINESPTIEAEPVKRGVWLPYLKEGLRYKCSECGSRFNLAYMYCPRCGARMEETK